MTEQQHAHQENDQEHTNTQAEPETTAAEGTPAPAPSASDYKLVIEDLNDKLLRAMAEAENIRRRSQQDIEKARFYSIESFAKDLLGVVDNLFRAAEATTDVANDDAVKALREGVELTKKEMLNVLERHHIKRLDPLGEKCNHNFHQPLSQIEDPSKESGTVINVMQAGYTLKDRLLRPALVVVVK